MLQKPGVKNLEWYLTSQINMYMGFGKAYSTQFELVLNMMNGPIALQFHIILMIYCIML